MAVTFAATFPRQIPKSVPVYELQKPGVSQASVVALAQAFGLKGDAKEFVTSPDAIGYAEQRYVLEVHRASGAVRYRHADAYGRQTEQPFDLTDQRVTGLARRFLAQSGVLDPASARVAKVTHLRGASADVESRRPREAILDAGVVYRRSIDGIGVTGPGGVAMVNIGADATVTGLTAVWRPLGRRRASVAILPAERVVAAFEKEAAKWKGDTTVVKAEFGYFEQGDLEAQSVIEPAFALVYVVRAGEVAFKSAYVVPAGEKTFAPLLGKKRFPAPETRRPKPK